MPHAALACSLLDPAALRLLQRVHALRQAAAEARDVARGVDAVHMPDGAVMSSLRTCSGPREAKEVLPGHTGVAATRRAGQKQAARPDKRKSHVAGIQVEPGPV